MSRAEAALRRIRQKHTDSTAFWYQHREFPTDFAKHWHDGFITGLATCSIIAGEALDGPDETWLAASGTDRELGDCAPNSTQHEAPAILAEDGDLATTYQRGGEAMMVPLLPGNPTGARRRPHDCIAERCDTDTRTPDQIEAEGWGAALMGADYDDVPYGHTHPDIRFSPWQRGRWKALGVWCDNHRRPFSWCVQEEVTGPCSERSPRARGNGEPTLAEWRARCLLAQSLISHRLDTATPDVAAVLAVLRGDLSLAGVE